MSAWLIVSAACVLTALVVWFVIELIWAPVGYENATGWHPGEPTADQARGDV